MMCVSRDPAPLPRTMAEAPVVRLGWTQTLEAPRYVASCHIKRRMACMPGGCNEGEKGPAALRGACGHADRRGCASAAYDHHGGSDGVLCSLQDVAKRSRGSGGYGASCHLKQHSRNAARACAHNAQWRSNGGARRPQVRSRAGLDARKEIGRGRGRGFRSCGGSGRAPAG